MAAQGSGTGRRGVQRAAATPFLALVGATALAALCACTLEARPQPPAQRGLAWLGTWAAPQQRTPRVWRKAAQAAQGLPTKRTDVFIRCIEEYDPADPKNEDFDEGPPATGFRSISEAIRPYHQNPEWMIWPKPGFARDQKICSMYTLATGLFQDINRAIREDNEDGIRRLAPFIWELRQVLRFKVDTIATPDGRKCKPFTGSVLRGLDLPVGECEKVAGLYKVGTEFTWPAFTACQLEEGGLWPFDGNLNFEIKCDIDVRKLGVKEVYAPVRISRFLGDSNEVLFPPHTKFRVVGEKPVERVTENEETRDVYTKLLEVVDLPAPWPEEQKRR